MLKCFFGQQDIRTWKYTIDRDWNESKTVKMVAPKTGRADVDGFEFWVLACIPLSLCPLTICIINTKMTLLYTYPSTILHPLIHLKLHSSVSRTWHTHTHIHSRQCGGDTRYTSAGARDRKCTFEQVEFNGKVAFTSKRFFSVFHITDQGNLALNRWTMT